MLLAGIVFDLNPNHFYFCLFQFYSTGLGDCRLVILYDINICIYMANLFLYYYENKWINKLKKSDIGRARRYSNIFRFIDDLSAFNDGWEFQNNYREIYPLNYNWERKIFLTAKPPFWI